MYRNLVTDLVRYERITTTEAKAKEIRPMAEKMVTLARRGDLHARRQALAFIYDVKVVKHLWDNIAPRMKDRPGGYLRITKLEPRKGDGAAMATIEFVDYGGSAVAMPRPSRVTAAPRFVAPPAAPAAPAAAPVVLDAPASEAEAAEAAQEEAVAEEVIAEAEETAVAEADEAAVAEVEESPSAESADADKEEEKA